MIYKRRSLELISIFLVCSVGWSIEAIPDRPFLQEYREFYVADANSGANDIRAIAVDGKDRVWIATSAGIFRLNSGRWELQQTGSAFTAVSANDGKVWIGAWNGLYCSSETGALEKIDQIQEAIGAIGVSGNTVVAIGPFGMWHNREGEWKKEKGDWASSPRAVIHDNDGTFWVPSGHGLFHIRDTSIVRSYHAENEILTGELRDAALAPDGKLWTGGLGGVDVFENGARCKSYTAKEGLPDSEVQSLTFAPDGVLWIGTSAGAARLDGETWSFRHGRRWLPNDDVRDIAFDSDGTAWIATAGGVSAIKRRSMTLLDKAEYFHDVLIKRKVRPPWLVEKSRLLTPGDVSTSCFEDDDNDGEYTNLYLAMEAYRYAVTKDPEARQNAQRAFEAMEFLQTVTGTSGFIARTVVPVDWASPNNPNPHRLHDRNRTYTSEQIADALISDPRFKPVEVRWRPSADGKWLWKGDTSSDEITGHFFGYYFYYEFVAQTEQDKQRVRDLIRRVMDYIIEGDLNLRDTDGTHTRWGVWNPDVLLKNADWRAERPLNCLEIVSYLKTTYYLTGDEKYQRLYEDLLFKHGFLEIVRKPKPTAPSERTHIDSDLLALVFPSLLKIETDPKLLAAYQEGLMHWFKIVEDEYSPFYSFICGGLGGMDIGTEQCVEFLRDAPLDLIRWTVDNSEREDVRLVRVPELDILQTDRLLPASERPVMRWDRNPYEATGGDGGGTESSGVYWLMPYWMGRYYGFISAPQ